jgi:tripeptide aminopeptidase
MTNNNHENVIPTFLELVQIDSPRKEEAAVASYINKYLANVGIDSRIDSTGNVVARLEGNDKFESHLLASHMDVVDPCRGVKPSIDNDGWIRSDGTTVLGADNKAGVAIILQSLSEVSGLPQNSRIPLDVVFTVSEESENLGAIGLDYSKIRSRQGYSFDTAGPLGGMTIASPAYTRFSAEMVGKAAHASKPEQGHNILPALTDLLAGVRVGRVDADTLVNIGTGQFGSATNSVPGIAQVVGEIRSMDETNIHTVLSQLRHLTEELISRHGISINFSSVRENGALNISANDPFVVATLGLVRNIIPEAHIKQSGGCSDANIFIEHGISVVNIGDGSLDAHAVTERIHRDSLTTMVEVVNQLITRANN